MNNYCKNKELALIELLEKLVGRENFKPGLERIFPLFLPIISMLQTQTQVVLVGGTNGKGEVSFALEALLLQQQKRVALWSSPHVFSVCERFRFEGQQCSQDQLLCSFEETKSQIEAFGLSYYEFLFFNFLRLAQVHKAEYLILEVGLGGRFDAVNLFDCDMAIITSIGRDHTEILGKTLREILGEKLAISRAGKPLITAFDLQYLKQLTKKYCAQNAICWSNLTLTGSFSLRNQELARASASKLLGLELAAVKECSSKGRFEIVHYKGKELCFVGSHNLAGIRSLASACDWNDYDSVMVSFSKRDLKEIENCIKLLSSFGKEVILTGFDHPKAANNFGEAVNWKDVLEDELEKSILITGSYYFIGEVQKYIFDCH